MWDEASVLKAQDASTAANGKEAGSVLVDLEVRRRHQVERLRVPEEDALRVLRRRIAIRRCRRYCDPRRLESGQRPS